MKCQQQFINKALKRNKRSIETHVYEIPYIEDGFGAVVRTYHNGHHWASEVMAVRYENGSFYGNAAWPTSILIETMSNRITWREIEQTHNDAIRYFFPHEDSPTKKTDWFVSRMFDVEEFRRQ